MTEINTPKRSNIHAYTHKPLTCVSLSHQHVFEWMKYIYGRNKQKKDQSPEKTKQTGKIYQGVQAQHSKRNPTILNTTCIVFPPGKWMEKKSQDIMTQTDEEMMSIIL